MRGAEPVLFSPARKLLSPRRPAMECAHLANALMPWYFNGTLANEETGIVRDHLRSCTICAVELSRLALVRKPGRAVFSPLAPAPRPAALLDLGAGAAATARLETGTDLVIRISLTAVEARPRVLRLCDARDRPLAHDQPLAVLDPDGRHCFTVSSDLLASGDYAILVIDPGPEAACVSHRFPFRVEIRPAGPPESRVL